ncbi:hypothetical protein BD311DRAFT_761643 [Dichomitus squalens]|uniref:Uncharacterized protein n=1 Tax=Dichomitus squalens TaxID=114155 RepID=A0A4Q9MHF7_9APHY|nr:hypothetical protein BD311DRAFT_761643 [Dichomitus squalens]
MPSSPAGPDPVPRSERDIVMFGGRRITLEYACAREIVGASAQERDRSRSRMQGTRDKKDRERRHRHRDANRNRKQSTADIPSGGLQQSHDHAHSRTQEATKEEEEEEDEDIPVADYDMHGDTDTEGGFTDAPTTPASSFALGELRSMTDDEESDSTIAVKKEVLVEGEGKKDEPMTVEIEVARSGPDDDLMDVAYVLCGLSQRR